MKLKLETEKNITILSVLGIFDSSKMGVLLAGLKKLLRDGKNRIILNVDPSVKMESDDLREIIKLNILASELSGEIILLTKDDSIRTKVASFSSPSFIHCFPTKEEALLHYQPKVEPLLVEKPVSKPSAEDLTLKQKLETVLKENDSLYKQLQNKILTARHLESPTQWEKKIKTLEEECLKLIELNNKAK